MHAGMKHRLRRMQRRSFSSITVITVLSGECQYIDGDILNVRERRKVSMRCHNAGSIFIMASVGGLYQLRVFYRASMCAAQDYRVFNHVLDE